MACAALSPLLDNPVFRPRSWQYLLLYCRKRCAPSRRKSLLRPAKAQNCNALTIQLIPIPSVLLQRYCVQGDGESLQNVVLRPMHANHLAPSLMRSLPPCSRGQRRSLLSATQIAPYSTSKRRRTRRDPPYEPVHFPSARSQYLSSRIFAQTRNRPESDGSLPKRGRPLSFVQSRSEPSTVSKVVWQPASLH